jgi:hypothetical protein
MNHPAETGSGVSWVWAQGTLHAAARAKRPIQFASEQNLLPRRLMVGQDARGVVVTALYKRRRISLDQADRLVMPFLADARGNSPDIARYVDSRRVRPTPPLVVRRAARPSSIRRASRRPRSPRLARRSAAKPKPPDDPPPPDPPGSRGPRAGGVGKPAWKLRVGVHLSVDGLPGLVRFAPGSARPQRAAELVGACFASCDGADGPPRVSLGRHRVQLHPSADARRAEPLPAPSRRAAGHVLP